MKPDLQKILAYWQAALRLQDWRIEIGYVANLATPDGAPVYGLCWPLADNRTAQIQIRDPEASTDGIAHDNVEDTVVHELLHCPMAALGAKDPAAVIVEEQIVWSLAGALVGAKGGPQEARLARAARAAIAPRQIEAPPRVAGARRRTMDPILVMIAALRGVLGGPDAAAAVEQAKALLDEFGKMVGAAEPEGDDPPAAAEPGAPGDMPPAARAADSPPAVERPARGLPQRRAVAAKSLTIADVQRVLVEDRQRGDLLVAARASRVGMTPALEAHLATRPLAEVRVLVDSLEVKATGTPPVPRAALAVGAGAVDGEAAAQPTHEEKIEIAKINAAFGHGAAAAKPTSGQWDLSRLKAAKAAK